MYSAHSSESKAQLLQRVSSLLQMELESLQDVRPTPPLLQSRAAPAPGPAADRRRARAPPARTRALLRQNVEMPRVRAAARLTPCINGCRFSCCDLSTCYMLARRPRGSWSGRVAP